jgi:hypothetical protein
MAKVLVNVRMEEALWREAQEAARARGVSATWWMTDLVQRALHGAALQGPNALQPLEPAATLAKAAETQLGRMELCRVCKHPRAQHTTDADCRIFRPPLSAG